MLGAVAKTLGAQSIFLGALGYWAPVRQQPCDNTNFESHSGDTESITVKSTEWHIQVTEHYFIVPVISHKLTGH